MVSSSAVAGLRLCGVGVAAIKKCLDNGTLSITMHHADLQHTGPEALGRARNPYLYD